MKYCVIKDTTILIEGSEETEEIILKNALQSEGKYTSNQVDILTEEEYKARINQNIDLIKQGKINELNQKCNQAIINGFYSDADGTKKLYDFELENQVNLSTKAYQLQIAKLAGQPITTVSYYAKGETCHDYTEEQFLKLALDGETWKTTNIVKYKDKLKPMVEACKTADEVKSITWESDINATQTTV
jgi:hypothetical protein